MTKATEASEMIATLQARIAKLESTRKTRAKAVRDYGPKSQRKMTESLALKIIIGMYRNTSVRILADDLGLSRAQIYSLRGQYTMKAVWKTAERILQRRVDRAS